MRVVKLFPKNNCKFHFGHLSLEINDYIFHSDSLFSTICYNFIRKYGKDDIDKFIQNFPKITSLFYGIRNNNKEILFLPKPSIFFFDRNSPDDKKKLKKIKFISVNVYEKFISDSLDYEECKINSKGNLIYLNEETSEDLILFEDIEEQKIAIDRLTLTSSEGHLYTISSIILHPNTFFYFLIDSDELNEKLKGCIEKIINFGIGGKISTGYGQIKKVVIETLKRENNFNFLNKEKDKFMSLSITFLKKNEIDKLLSYYLIERKGWIYLTSYRKKPLIGLREGAIFKSKIDGSCIDVSLNNNLKSFRFGKAFLIPFKNLKKLKNETI